MKIAEVKVGKENTNDICIYNSHAFDMWFQILHITLVSSLLQQLKHTAGGTGPQPTCYWMGTLSNCRWHRARGLSGTLCRHISHSSVVCEGFNSDTS